MILNHSQFSDDTVIFAQPNAKELNRIKYILHVFSQLSGHFPLEYLGIPIGLTRERVSMWEPVINKVKRKLAGWKGDGASILFWFDPWAGGRILKDDFPSLFFISEQKTSCVKSFRFPPDISTRQLGWNLHLSFPLSEFNRLKAQQLHAFLARFSLLDSVSDQLIWAAGPSEAFSIADAIRLLVQSSNVIHPVWPKVVWGNNVPSKIMVFHWLAIKDSIPVKDVLARRHILPSNIPSVCVFCRVEVESVNHLLIHCKWTSSIWTELFRWWNIRWVIPRSIVDFSFDWYYGMGIKASRFWKLIGPATIWAIWMTRNDVVFNGTVPCRSFVIRNVKLKSFLWATNLKLVHGLQAYVWEQNLFLLCL
ncbi:uncharacterized protein [Rutidosis leptorrhynchoides]|uniref:uncharacterized protein n=1 Tax=Rutidosis leptorrhynchoides TaxID=125765 RepID=UPI003A9953E4